MVEATKVNMVAFNGIKGCRDGLNFIIPSGSPIGGC